LKAQGKMLPNHKFGDYNQDFANMLGQLEMWVSLKMTKKKESNYKYENLEATDASRIEDLIYRVCWDCRSYSKFKNTQQ